MKLDEWFAKTAPSDILKELHKRYTDQLHKRCTDQMYIVQKYFVCPIDIYTNDLDHIPCPKHENCDKCIEDFMHKEMG